MNTSKFNPGDNVRVINYGSLVEVYCSSDPDTLPNAVTDVIGKHQQNKLYDISPDIVGKVGKVRDVVQTGTIFSYALDGIPGKCAWYDEQQLEKL